MCSFLLLDIRKSTVMFLRTHPYLLSTRMNKAEHIFTNTAELLQVFKSEEIFTAMQG